MADPIPLLRALPAPEPDPNLLRTIQELLEMAQSGELQDVAWAGVDRDGKLSSQWHHSGRLGWNLSAAIARLGYRYQREAVDPEVEQDDGA